MDDAQKDKLIHSIVKRGSLARRVDALELIVKVLTAYDEDWPPSMTYENVLKTLELQDRLRAAKMLERHTPTTPSA